MQFFYIKISVGVLLPNRYYRAKIFYTLWTIKESYLKFTEIGIRGLDSVDVIKIKNNHAVVKNIYNNETIYVKIIYLNNKFVISLCI